jgi:hypothetical protein
MGDQKKKFNNKPNKPDKPEPNDDSGLFFTFQKICNMIDLESSYTGKTNILKKFFKEFK